ncbi:hypothetical protein ACJX0J_001247 [Zea mays]
MDLPGPIHEILVLFGGFGLLLGGLGVMGLLYSFNHNFDLIDKELCLFIFDCRNMKSNLIFLLSIYVEFITKYIALFIENFYVEKENLEIQCHILNDTLGWIMGFSGQNVSCLYYFIMSYFPWLTNTCCFEIKSLGGSILLTGFITTLATLAAWPVTRNSQLFYFLMLAIPFTFFYHVGVRINSCLLTFIHVGGKRRLYSATKFILYTAGGSIFFLIGVLGMGLYGSNEPGLDLERLINQSYPTTLEILLYFGFLIAYAVKLPIIPVHTCTCMLLAGILLKMGAYGLIRVNMELLPHAHYLFFPLVASTSLGQRNFKKRIAYSSVSHMGFIIIGIGSITNIGLNGAILQILSHGFIGATTFFLGGNGLTGGNIYPNAKIFTMFSSFSMASLALPGMSGFVAELVVFFGLITSPKFMLMPKMLITFVMAIGMILTPIYLLSMLRQMFYGYKLFHVPTKIL